MGADQFYFSKRNLSFLVLSAALVTSCTEKMKKKSIVSKELTHYSSASGIEFVNNKIYLIGDDANSILIVDSNFNTIDSISLYKYSEKRIPKAVKADLESMTILPDGNIFLCGSGYSYFTIFKFSLDY